MKGVFFILVRLAGPVARALTAARSQSLCTAQKLSSLQFQKQMPDRAHFAAATFRAPRTEPPLASSSRPRTTRFSCYAKGAVIFFIALLSGLVVYAAEDGFVYDSKGKSDPFVPLVSKEGVYIGRQTGEVAEDIILEGIVWDPEGESFAIVNGKVIKEGDVFLNLKVLEIKREGIRILKGDKEIIVNLVSEAQAKLDK